MNTAIWNCSFVVARQELILLGRNRTFSVELFVSQDLIHSTITGYFKSFSSCQLFDTRKLRHQIAVIHCYAQLELLFKYLPNKLRIQSKPTRLEKFENQANTTVVVSKADFDSS